MNGLELFIKYALPPNILGYCGPSAPLGTSPSGNITNNITNNTLHLRNLLLQFEGAVPYLRLIAQSNNIKDEFDPRVVEAYWLGNSLLEKVKSSGIYSNVEERFKKRMSAKDWRWLVAESVPMSKPHHVFHVFDIYRRAGLMRSGAIENVLETINNCRISWGKILRSCSGQVEIEYNPLVFVNNRLQFGPPAVKSLSLLSDLFRANDVVSFHWDYICDKITEQQQQNLEFWTKYHLDLTNKTI